MAEVPRFDAEYSSEQISRFRYLDKLLEDYNLTLERWADEGYKGPRPEEPEISDDEIYQLRLWQKKRMWARYYGLTTE